MKNIIYKSKILLPKEGTDLTKWAVIACDQHTSEGEYWQETESIVGDAQSTLNIILPEVYLEETGVEKRIENIQKTMAEYKKTVLTREVDGFVYVRRTIGENVVREGLVAAIDLEDYSFEKGKKPLIRPSEATVVSRIPPRLAVRRGASLECPHIMMLLDDDKFSIVEPIGAMGGKLPKCYSAKLMQNGGELEGFAIENEELINEISNKINAIAQRETFDEKYPFAKGDETIAMAVGDGNHSLATAKAYWEEIKKDLSPDAQKDHPARFCLVEIVNIHSKAIEVEPIHRVVFGIDEKTFNEKLVAFYGEKNLNKKTAESHNFKIITQNSSRDFSVNNPKWAIATATIEAFLDSLTAENIEIKVDYIHGETAVQTLANKGAIGILLPEFKKSDLFLGVVKGGVLPRKTFSMGQANEKRYYMETRQITKE
ncbi:MAG: DUF1015 domain-containing protein [Oscillospiraceae bacterium]